jgi:hypothetical protein
MKDRSPDGIGGLQAAVRKNADAAHRLWRNPGLESAARIPDYAALHPGYSHHHISFGVTANGGLLAPLNSFVTEAASGLARSPSSVA